MTNEKLQAAFEPTNLDLFDKSNLKLQIKDIEEQMRKTKNQADYLQLRDYLIQITLELELRQF
jgi:hypothetical protein